MGRSSALCRDSGVPVAVQQPRKVAVAPMMDCTDRHDRYLLRLISRRVLLYTEMVTTGALLFGDRARFLAFHPSEHPVALQIGGNDPLQMARCARWVEDAGYDEININVGCPSNRVKSGGFGACLMLEPQRVAACYRAMARAVAIPVTIKTRIGVDDRDSYHDLCEFVDAMADAGCRTFIVHARKAWLEGVSPKHNRTLPPLRYDVVYRLKHDYPELEIVINGGVTDLAEIDAHLQTADGVMIGRAAYQNPYLLADIDARFFGDTSLVPSRGEVLERYIEYMRREVANGVYLKHLARHLFGLFSGLPGAKAWRRHLSENMYGADVGVEVVNAAARHVVRSTLKP